MLSYKVWKFWIWGQLLTTVCINLKSSIQALWFGWKLWIWKMKMLLTKSYLIISSKVTYLRETAALSILHLSLFCVQRFGRGLNKKGEGFSYHCLLQMCFFRVWLPFWRLLDTLFHSWMQSMPTTIPEKWCWSWFVSFRALTKKWKRLYWR